MDVRVVSGPEQVARLAAVFLGILGITAATVVLNAVYGPEVAYAGCAVLALALGWSMR